MVINSTKCTINHEILICPINGVKTDSIPRQNVILNKSSIYPKAMSQVLLLILTIYIEKCRVLSLSILKIFISHLMLLIPRIVQSNYQNLHIVINVARSICKRWSFQYIHGDQLDHLIYFGFHY